MTREQLDEAVCAVLHTLDDLPPHHVRTLAAGLALGGEPVAWFADPVRYYANDRESALHEPSPLARITMASALRKSAHEGTLVSKLADAEAPFWRAVEDALVAVATDALPVET